MGSSTAGVDGFDAISFLFSGKSGTYIVTSKLMIGNTDKVG
jgi:hypothetical protein